MTLHARLETFLRSAVDEYPEAAGLLADIQADPRDELIRRLVGVLACLMYFHESESTAYKEAMQALIAAVQLGYGGENGKE